MPLTYLQRLYLVGPALKFEFLHTWQDLCNLHLSKLSLQSVNISRLATISLVNYKPLTRFLTLPRNGILENSWNLKVVTKLLQVRSSILIWMMKMMMAMMKCMYWWLTKMSLICVDILRLLICSLVILRHHLIYQHNFVFFMLSYSKRN